jgi:MarR family transcriptional regulator, organic hydroperoxide resistance regulator
MSKNTMPIHPADADNRIANAQAAAEQIARDLGRIRKLLRQPLDEEIAKGNLTGPQRAVMQAVVRPLAQDAGGLSLKDLSAQVGLAQSTVSGIVDRLAQRGMLERRADPTDGRAIRIHPTPPVIEFLKQRLPSLQNDPLKRALSSASISEIAAIQQALLRLRELLEASPN